MAKVSISEDTQISGVLIGRDAELEGEKRLLIDCKPVEVYSYYNSEQSKGNSVGYYVGTDNQLIQFGSELTIDTYFISTEPEEYKDLMLNVIDNSKTNTPYATYDLRKGLAGELPHNPEDLITKITACSPGEEGKQIWLDALKLFFCKDQKLIDYVQETVGMAAIGKVYQENMIIAYGGGANGKSTFWNTIFRVLGNYAGKLSAEALTMNCKRNVKPEMAELKGKRLIISSEMEEGMRLNTAVVKQLCSTDEIQAEKKYKDPFSFVPSHTLVLYTNHLPKVGANDDGIWRRLVVIPFNAKITGKSDIKNYADYLFEHAGPAIMSWIIEGAKRAIDKNFHTTLPDVVEAAVQAYREENDWLGQFLEECCEIDPSYKEKSGELYQAYRAHCMQNGEYIRSTTDFYSSMDKAGYNRIRKNTGVQVVGLKLKEGQDFLGGIMGDTFFENLFYKQEKQFEKINDLSKAFAVNYCGNTIIRESIFGIVSNYARKRELALEVLRYPFRDDELWAFTFVKKGTIFLCVNTELPMCKQIFATAHELYHIHCYAEDINTSTITSGSLLDSKTVDEVAATQEDLEANAFAGLLLMPDASVIEQFKMFGISKENMGIDDVLILMDLFALPYKAVVLRLVESGVITEEKARNLYQEKSESIAIRIELTGKAEQWQQNSGSLLRYGSLLDNLAFNSEHELLVDSREESDRAYLEKIGKEFRNRK